MTGPKVRLKSWNSLPRHFASLQAVAQLFRNSCTGFPPWNTSEEITLPDSVLTARSSPALAISRQTQSRRRKDRKSDELLTLNESALLSVEEVERAGLEPWYLCDVKAEE
jgi:hypothetical protein